MSPIIVPGPDTGGRSFGDLIQEVLANDFSDSYYDRAGQYLNEALRRVARRVKLPGIEATEDYTTVAGEGTITPPVDFVRLVSLRNTDDAMDLRNLSQDDLDQYPAADGRPMLYAHYGGQLTLYPTPDAAYPLQLRYRRVLSEFSATTDTTGALGFPDDYADALVSYARHKLFRFEDDAELSGFWWNEWNRQLGELMTDEQSQYEDEVRQVPSMWDRQPSGPRFTEPA